MPGTELTLDEMLADPIVQLLMHRDGVKAGDVRALARRWRRRAIPASGAVADPSPALASSKLAQEACLV